MVRYDHVIVGGGVGGLTASLLLAMAGKKVLLIECGPRIGGSLARFSRNGIPFDTGFHFTGGFSEDGLLNDMLHVLGMDSAITPIFPSPETSNQFIFEKEQLAFNFPYGIERLTTSLKSDFPGEARAIDIYFDRVRDVCRRTSSMSLSNLLMANEHIDEDFISLQDMLDELTEDAFLKALLSAFCMCYGVQPREISFANHSRMCLGLYESLARVKNGGQAFICAFLSRIEELDVSIACNCRIVNCEDVQGDRIHGFTLSTGEEVSFDSCLFTIHPKEVLKIIPRELLSNAFVNRINSFESSCGFFSIFGTINEKAYNALGASIVSLLPSCDINDMLDPTTPTESALVIMKTEEESGDGIVQTISAFEPSFMEEVAQWEGTERGNRPNDYIKYKAEKTDRMCERIGAILTGGKDEIDVLDSASVLTFKDYLHSPDGSAYGIKQKMGQFNMVGKLPIRNFYAAGQSSVLPGVVGAMMSSFLVSRTILGKDAFGILVDGRKRR